MQDTAPFPNQSSCIAQFRLAHIVAQEKVMVVTRSKTEDDRHDEMRMQMHIPQTTSQHIRFFLHWMYTMWLDTCDHHFTSMLDFSDLHEVLLDDEPGMGFTKMLILLYTDIQNQFSLQHRQTMSDSYVTYLRIMRKIVLDKAVLLGEDWVPV